MGNVKDQAAQAAEGQGTVKKEGGQKGSIFDLEDQFAFYGQYHVNPTNIGIHILCVPLILWSWIILFNLMTKPFTLGHVNVAGYDVSLTPGFLWAASYAAYFVILEPGAGLAYAPILLGMAYTSNTLPAQYPDQIFKVAMSVFVFSWAAQIYGHQVHEHRAPALLDNLAQSLVLAVFFVWLEVFFMLGYRPQLHKRLKNRIGKAVTEYRRSQKAKA